MEVRSIVTHWSSRLVGILLLLAFAYQFRVDWTTYGRPWTEDVLATWADSSVERAVRYQHWLDQEDRAFIAYLRDRIPENATVMIPERDAHFVFGHRRMLQQFLLPRRIVRCDPTTMGGVEGCLAMAREQSHYLLLTDEFEVGADGSSGFEVHVYRDALTLGVPREGGEG